MFKGIKGLLATLAIATGAWAQGNVWDGSADTTWYTTNKDETQFTITTPAQLAGLARLVNGVSGASGNGRYNMENKTITLGNDIMLNDTTGWQDWETTAPENSWTAIGTSTTANQFTGTFDGAGYVVGGVYINNSSNYQGLFGYVGGDGTIKNLGAVASYVKGQQYVGGLVGRNSGGGTITNSYAAGTVSGPSNVGGLVGRNDGGSTITNSYAAGNVTGTSYVGGLAGSNINGTIANSYATGTVSGADSPVGGLVGNNTGTITGSYAAGTVTGTGNNVGGLVGINSGTITNSYAAGTVSGKERIGGLAGYNSGGGTITNSYAAGTVSGTSYEADGLVGNTDGGTITSSYYDITTNGGSNNRGGTPKTTDEMKTQETYDGWDFDAVWAIDPAKNSGYPYLLFPASNISGAITSAVYNETKPLSGTVQPWNAYNETIVWSVISGGATISGNNITFNAIGQVTIRATITNGLGNGSDYTQDFNINVAKAAGTFVATTALNATYTPTLTLANITPPDNYAWSAPTTSLSAGNNQTFAATYTDPSGNYNPATGNITVNVAKANGTGTVAITGWTFGQAANAPTISGQTAEYGAPSYTYSAQGANSFTATVPTAAGSYTVKATFAATANYNEYSTTADFAIAKANGTGTVAITGWTYGQPASTPTISGQTAEYSEPSYTYSAQGANDYTATVPTAVGSYTVKATFTATANYNEHTATADFAIAAIPTYAVAVTNGTGSGSYEAGATVTLTANAPEAGMEFKNWDITPAVTFTAGNAATPEAEFTMPAEAVTATAVYEAIPINNHLITVTVEGNGIANANVVSATQGTEIMLTATPHEGNRFVRWDVVSGDITLSSTTTATATFTIPNNAVAVKAVFEVIQTPILPSQLATGNKAVQTSNGLNLTATGNATVEIFNLKGSLISRQNFASGVHAIQLGHLPKGMYIVKTTFGNEKQVLRMPVR